MSDAPAVWAGIDAGGSKTLAVVVDARGQELGRALADGANYQAIGLERAREHLLSALEAALHAAGQAHAPVATWVGMAGIDRPADRAIWQSQLGALTGRLRLSNDAELALADLDGAAGVALIAGTGAIALGRDMTGQTARASGWGHVIGDEGSGYDIGRACLRAVARAADGRGQQTALLGLLARAWALETPEAMIGRVYPAEDKAGIARLAPLVFAAARDGDGVAGRIVAHAASELAHAAVTVRRALLFQQDGLPLALGGGLLINDSAFRARVIGRIRRHCALGQVAVVTDPALSAARAAAQLWASDRWAI